MKTKIIRIENYLFFLRFSQNEPDTVISGSFHLDNEDLSRDMTKEELNHGRELLHEIFDHKHDDLVFQTIDLTRRGVPVETRFGTFHTGDILHVWLYQDTAPNGGTEIVEYEGALVYRPSDSCFLIKDETKGVSFNLKMAKRPVLVMDCCEATVVLSEKNVKQ